MAMHDEFERIHWLKARYELDGAPAGTVIGIGDDANLKLFFFGEEKAIVALFGRVAGRQVDLLGDAPFDLRHHTAHVAAGHVRFDHDAALDIVAADLWRTGLD